MSFLLDFCLPALLVSSAAVVALRCIPESSVPFRAMLALAGLLAWFVPWHLVAVPVVAEQTLPLTQWIGTASTAFENASLASGPATEVRPAAPTGPWWLLLFLPGTVVFLLDVIRRNRWLAGLERQSRDGERLRSLLPDVLQLVPARIRIIPGTNAMATGVLRGTLWAGEELCPHPELKAALVHECCHLRRRDSVLVLAVHLVRRLYCWNPVVLMLTGHLHRLIEQACDLECADLLGKTSYRRSLARLIVDARASGIALVPMVMGASSDFRRIRALEGAPASAFRRVNATAAMLAAALVAVSLNAQQPDPRIGEWREDSDSPGYQGLYVIYEDLGNGMVRSHIAENLAPANRLHMDSRCDGDFYPSVYADGAPTGTSTSCRIVDANTLAFRWISDRDERWARREGTLTLSSDGDRLTTVIELKDRDGNVIERNERRFTRNAESCLDHDREDLFRECRRRTAPEN